MGGRQSRPQEATFERPDRGERGFSMQFSPDLVRALASEGTVPGLAPPKPPSPKPAKREQTEVPEREHTTYERAKPRQTHNVEQLMKQAREEGVKQGKAEAEAEADERAQRVVVELLEKEAAKLEANEQRAATKFADLTDSLDKKFGVAPLKQRQCNADYQATYECYIKNPQRPLNCADEVKKFQECVRGATKTFLTSSAQ
eukprot:comp21417_c0_seq1/m.29518 comp21417_c0_seq1/g.29518  ORF comp21417_c0_seq1/g.29518 comp21417_c0_seq1/m.29518 type:complete len:201 (-) comp21417_c0_seq1:700-1302(-)